MTLALIWIGLSIAIGAIAANRGRNFFGWFLIALFLSPLIGGLLLAASGDARSGSVPAGPPRWACPYCAEPVMIEAKVCPHCRSTLPPVDRAVFRDYPEVYGQFRYKRQRDGSVLLATPTGPRRFRNWAEFWRAVN